MPKQVSATVSSILDNMGVFDPVQRSVMIAYTETLIMLTCAMGISSTAMKDGFFIIEELLKAELASMELEDKSPKRNKRLAPPRSSDLIH